MSHQLNQVNEAYLILKDTLKVLRRHQAGIRHIYGNTIFSNKNAAEVEQMLSNAGAELDRVAPFMMFAAFERALRDHLKENIALMDEKRIQPRETASTFRAQLSSSLDRWRLDNVIRLYSPPATPEQVLEAQQIKNERDIVAHGVHRVASLPPKTVFNRLRTFLRTVHL